MKTNNKGKKKIEIKQEEVKIVTEIKIDGKVYPLHRWNIDKANKYLLSNDEKYLDELKDFSLDI